MRLVFHKLAQLLSSEAGIHRWTRLTGGSPQQKPPIFSLDNDGIHSHPDTLTNLGLFDGLTRLPLPAHSPDLHRTVERAHARICGPFQAWVNDQTTELTPAVCLQQLMYIFYNTQKASVIEADMSDIRDLYTRVLELGGSRPPKRFR